MKIFWVIFLFSFSCLNADEMQKAYEQGQSFGEGKTPPPEGGIVNLLPDFLKKSPPSFSSDPSVLEHQAHPDPDTIDLLRAPESYIIDPEHDPLFKNADAIVADPFSALRVETDDDDEPVDVERKACVETQPLTERRCVARLVPQQVGVDREEKSSQVLTAQEYPDLSGIPKDHILSVQFQGYKISTEHVIKKSFWSREKNTIQRIHGSWFLIRYFEEKPRFELVWESSCSEWDASDCTLESERCLEGPGERVVEGVTFNAPCWSKELIFSCQEKGENTCQPLRQQGCSQEKETCLEKDQEGLCTKWEKIFVCPKGEQRLPKKSLKGPKPFCLDGDCNDVKWAPNQDMAEALSKLAVLDGMQKDAHSMNVFQGKSRQCSRDIANFKDCCRRRGWGMDIGLSGCSEEDKVLATDRNNNLCVFVGTYCSKKVMKICVQKRSSFCCFGSKLARIVQDQGRQQLGLGWGDPKNPHCQGLSIEQVQNIDFGKIDLSELFQDLQNKMKTPKPSITKPQNLKEARNHAH